jgi:Zn-dependent protease
VTLAFSHIIMLVVLASSARDVMPPIGPIVIGLVFFISILLHEWGHVIACRSVGGIAEHIILGPMGGLAAVQPPDRPLPHFITTAGGPAVNALLMGIFWAILKYASLRWIANLETNFGMGILYFIASMIYINKMLLIFNLLPIFPMDGGRLLQHILWPTAGYRQSMLITGMVGTVGGMCLLLLGLGLWEIQIPYIDFAMGTQGETDYFLIMIGITSAMASWGLYQRAKQIQNWRKN